MRRPIACFLALCFSLGYATTAGAYELRLFNYVDGLSVVDVPSGGGDYRLTLMVSSDMDPITGISTAFQANNPNLTITGFEYAPDWDPGMIVFCPGFPDVQPFPGPSSRLDVSWPNLSASAPPMPSVVGTLHVHVTGPVTLWTYEPLVQNSVFDLMEVQPSTVTFVPEPASILLVGMGLLVLRRR